jgi:hypothetical protein
MAFSPEHHQFHAPAFAGFLHQALEFFNHTPLAPLPPIENFIGVGVYAVYLLEHPDLYTAFADPGAIHPIYVGKAVPYGWRTAREQDQLPGNELFRRLTEHARSLHTAENLQISWFRTRFIFLSGIESDLIVPIEAALIRQHKPLWNVVIDGFGNHDPGKGRYNQAVSAWDTLHPGRAWVTNLTGNRPDRDVLIDRINRWRTDRSIG